MKFLWYLNFSVHKTSSSGTQPRSFIYLLSMTAFTLQGQAGVAATDTTALAKPNAFTALSRKPLPPPEVNYLHEILCSGNVCNHLLKTMFFFFLFIYFLLLFSYRCPHFLPCPTHPHLSQSILWPPAPVVFVHGSFIHKNNDLKFVVFEKSWKMLRYVIWFSQVHCVMLV